LKVNNASCWFLLCGYITMHDLRNIKKNTTVYRNSEIFRSTLITYGNPCKETKPDARFILSLFRQSTSTCFGNICRPLSGGILYIYNWHVLCFLVDCLLSIATRTTDSQPKGKNTCQLLYVCNIPLDDGLQVCPKHAAVEWQNKLRIHSRSSWFSLHGCIEMHGQQNIKNIT